jgi:hypothetical protein
MKPPSSKVLELIESRLELLRALIHMEREWRGAFIALKLRDSERCAADEELICERIRALDREIASFQAIGRETGSAKSSAVDQVIDCRIHIALAQMESLHLDLKNSNQVKQSILRRSKFTLNALQNLFNSHAPTYAAPATPSTGMIYEENV